MGMQPLRIGIYAPYLRIAGGGERFVGSIAARLSRAHRVAFIVTEDVDLGWLQRYLNLDLSRVQLDRVHVASSSFYAAKWEAVRQVSRASANYDLFLNQERLSCIPCRAQRVVLLCEVPPSRFNPSSPLRDNWARLLGARLFFDAESRTYRRIIANSHFVARAARRYYRRDVAVLYPPTDTEQFEPGAKQNVILSVGRFFVGRHCKKQDVLIRTFQSLYQTYPEMLNWEYHLVGGIDPNAPSSLYAERCERQARGYPIMFHVNAPFDLLQQLYSHAKIFWHAAGFGEDEVRRPDCMEHFGIATVEAMAAGCVPVMVGKGGQREVVQAGMNGLYWSTCDELAQQTRDLIRDDTRLAALRANAQARSQDFGMAAFERMLERVLELDDG